MAGSVEGLGPITEDTTFELTCFNAVGNELSDSVIVTVLPPDFSLQRSTGIELSGVRGTSTPATLTVVPLNNFTSRVDLVVAYLRHMAVLLDLHKLCQMKPEQSVSPLDCADTLRAKPRNPGHWSQT